MIARYEIAQYLTDAEKAAMCAAHYVWPGGIVDWHPRRTLAGECPLGVAGLGAAPFRQVPYAAAVTHRLCARLPACPGGAEVGTILQAALTLIADWDAGVLTPADLPAALGLEP